MIRDPYRRMYIEGKRARGECYECKDPAEVKADGHASRRCGLHNSANSGRQRKTPIRQINKAVMARVILDALAALHGGRRLAPHEVLPNQRLYPCP